MCRSAAAHAAYPKSPKLSKFRRLRRTRGAEAGAHDRVQAEPEAADCFMRAQAHSAIPTAMTRGYPGLTRREFARGLAVTSSACLIGSAFPAFAQGAPAFDPRQFGARGDGRADDTVALQRAADAAQAANGIVSIPRGVTFGISDYVLIRDGVRGVVGPGTIRVLRSARGQCALVGAGVASGNPSNLHACEFRDFTFDANGMRSLGVYCQNAQSCAVIGVRVLNSTEAIGILFKTFSNGREPGRNNRVEQCTITGDPSGNFPGTVGIAFESETDFSTGDATGNAQRSAWRRGFQAQPPALAETGGIVAGCRVDGNYYGISLGAAQNVTVSSVTCANNMRGITLNNSSRNRLVECTVADSLSSAVNVGYGSCDNIIDRVQAISSRAAGEALFQSIIGSQRNVFTGCHASATSRSGPHYYYYCAVQSDGCQFIDCTASGPVQRAYVGVESAWSSKVRNPGHRAIDAGTELDGFAGRGMGGVLVRGVNIDGKSARPAVYLGQISDEQGAYALTDIEIDEASITGRGFSERVARFEQTPGLLQRSR